MVIKIYAQDACNWRHIQDAASMIGPAMLDIDPDAQPDTVRAIHLMTQAITRAQPYQYFSVAELDGSTVGFLGGALYHLALEPRTYAQDILAYVMPEARGSAAYYEMSKAFRDWAFGMGASEVRGILRGAHADKIASASTRLGFEDAGRLVIAKRPKTSD